jgi:hypothetical protein
MKQLRTPTLPIILCSTLFMPTPSDTLEEGRRACQLIRDHAHAHSQSATAVALHPKTLHRVRQWVASTGEYLEPPDTSPASGEDGAHTQLLGFPAYAHDGLERGAVQFLRVERVGPEYSPNPQT